MKKFYFLGAMLCVAVCVHAYEAGPASRTNFGSAQQSSATQQNGYRSFSNSNTRSWGQGVQTKPVQTSLAGSSAKEFQAPVGKQVAPSAKPAKPVKPAATAAAQPSTAQASTPANADPAAMMQQVQSMMQNMQNLPGGAAGATPNAQQPAANQGMPAGMPDISALMGGMMPAAPAAAPTSPAKK